MGPQIDREGRKIGRKLPLGRRSLAGVGGHAMREEMEEGRGRGTHNQKLIGIS